MAQISKGYTYTNSNPTNEVTASNLNQLADAATLLVGAITEQTLKAEPLINDQVLIYSVANNALRKAAIGTLPSQDSSGNTISFEWDGANVCAYVNGVKKGTIPA